MFTCVLGRSAASTVLLVPRPFRRALTASVRDRWPEIRFNDIPSYGRVWRKGAGKRALFCEGAVYIYSKLS